MRRLLLVLVAALCLVLPALAQDNSEIQVYASDTVEPGATMFETHTNFTPSGHGSQGGLRPTDHSWHETFEITHGWNCLLYTSPSPRDRG